MSNTKHACFGPSRLDALSKCVRFKYIEMEGGNDAATEGTLLHKAFETGDLDGLDEEQTAQVQKLLDYRWSLIDTGNWTEYKELRVELKDLTFGTADRVLTSPDKKHIHVLDAKFGRVAGDSYDFQVRTYGAAVVESLWEGNEMPSDIIVETHILVPRRNEIEHATYNGQDLHTAIRQEIADLYERIANPFTPPTPHSDLCHKCAWASQCPAFQAIVNRTAAQVLKLPVPEEFALNGFATPRDRAIAQVLATAVTNWADQVKKNNAEFVAEGGEVPMHKLVVRSTGLRVPSDFVTSAFISLREAGIPEEVILDGCSMALGRMAKAMADYRGVSEGEAKEALRTALGDLAVEGQTKFLQRVKRLADEEVLKLV